MKRTATSLTNGDCHAALSGSCEKVSILHERRVRRVQRTSKGSTDNRVKSEVLVSYRKKSVVWSSVIDVCDTIRHDHGMVLRTKIRLYPLSVQNTPI